MSERKPSPVSGWGFSENITVNPPAPPAPPAAPTDLYKEALAYLFQRQPQTNGEIAEAMVEFAEDKLARAESELERLREALEIAINCMGAAYRTGYHLPGFNGKTFYENLKTIERAALSEKGSKS